MRFDVRTAADLYVLKQLAGLDLVRVDLSAVKYEGLAHHAARLAFFAVREGGQIVLTDGRASKLQSIAPGLIGWPSLRALIIRALGRACCVQATTAPGEMRFVRQEPLTVAGWSAGVIFSGSDKELPALFRCLDGLMAQPELSGEQGEILVCGPTRDTNFLSAYPKVTYFTFDLDDAPGPFPISRKKNALLRRMRFPRRLVLHCRIVMEPGALAKAPSEFDILGPNVIQRSRWGDEANVGFVCVDPRWPALQPERFERSTLNVSPMRYMTMLKTRRPYVDGAAFAVNERVLRLCELDENLLWGDCEDVEWCFRAQSHGFLVDMCPQMMALNAASKVRTLEALPPFVAHKIRAANRVVRVLKNWQERYLHGR